jgi:hypothetical protein
MKYRTVYEQQQISSRTESHENLSPCTSKQKIRKRVKDMELQLSPEVIHELGSEQPVLNRLQASSLFFLSGFRIRIDLMGILVRIHHFVSLQIRIRIQITIVKLIVTFQESFVRNCFIYHPYCCYLELKYIKSSSVGVNW